MKKAFSEYDTDGSGGIDPAEFKELMKKLGYDLSEAELDTMYSETDTDGDGELDFEEFKVLMQKCPAK
jgi:calmodulin